MENGELFDKVRLFNFQFGEYALFGSAPICIRGLRECRDIDIIVTENLWNECKDKKGWEVKEMSHGSKYLFNNEIELWKDWKPGKWDINLLIKNAEIIDGLPFVKLENVIKWKKLSGREKDLVDVNVIENFLSNL